jgi:CheY-like chemotaxis protein
VVEDEPLLRMLAVEVVEEAGFIAIEACDADEAVILLESRADITLLFTDIDMPGSIDGLKLAHAVRDRWPPIKILVVSGKQRPQLSDLPLNSCFVEKPYRVSALVQELRSLAGSHNQTGHRRRALLLRLVPRKCAQVIVCLGASIEAAAVLTCGTERHLHGQSPDRSKSAKQSTAGGVGARQPQAD